MAATPTLQTAPPFAAGQGKRGAIPRSERIVTLLMLGRLWRGHHDTICRIRNISSGGMCIDTGAALETGEPLTIEARSGCRVEGRVVWTRQVSAGVAFANNIDPEELISPFPSRSGKTLPPRGPRFQTAASAQMEAEGRRQPLRIADLSLGGCAIECETILPLDMQGCLAIPGLPPLAFASRWVNGNRAGLIFLARPDFVSFARWLESPELRFAAASGAAAAGAPHGC